MPSLKDWISSARPRTLPLALAATGMGNVLALPSADFKAGVFVLSIVTTLFLQILSNFANDYGDSIHGADGKTREGPSRAVQAGIISAGSMKNAILLFAGLSLVSGLVLLYQSFQSDWGDFLPLLFIGVLAIAAAYFYTNGKKPYGYMALGDASVFLFFGLVAVMATTYLHTKTIALETIFPAIALGFWSTAVLNLNNMRDMKSDQTAGKFTIPLFLGFKKAKVYQTFLVVGGIANLAAFCGIFPKGTQLFLGSIPGLVVMLVALSKSLKTEIPVRLDPYLKPQALGTFLAVLGMFLASLF